MALPGNRRGGRPQRRSVDVVKEDMEMLCVKLEESVDRMRWKQIIGCGNR